MTNLIRSNFQDHPFHLVSPSPWPLFTSVCLFNLTTSAALAMHNFSNSYYVNYISFLLLVSVMSLWFRDIISEATTFIGISAKDCLYTLGTARAITDKDVSESLSVFKLNSNSYKIYENNLDNFGYYLAGLSPSFRRKCLSTSPMFGFLIKRNKSSSPPFFLRTQKKGRGWTSRRGAFGSPPGSSSRRGGSLAPSRPGWTSRRGAFGSPPGSSSPGRRS